MKNCLGTIFYEIPYTIAHGLWPNSGANLNTITIKYQYSFTTQYLQ